MTSTSSESAGALSLEKSFVESPSHSTISPIASKQAEPQDDPTKFAVRESLILPLADPVSVIVLSPSPTPTFSSENTAKLAVSSTAIPGVLNPNNSGTLDWGWQGFLAYGCQSLVVVLDSHSMTKVQVLDHHKYPVSQVKWARENYCHGPRQSYNPRLASADTHGNLIVWEMIKGVPQSKFAESDSPVCDMAWHWHQDATNDMLLCLHPNSTFILWNASTGTMIWKKVFPRIDHLEAFDLDPRQPTRALFIAADGVWMMHDLTLFKASTGDLQKITWSHDSRSGVTAREASLTKESASSPSSIRSDIRQRAVRLLARNQTGPHLNNVEAESNFLIEIFFHRRMNDVLIAVYPRQIVFVSLRYSAAFRIISVEKASAALSTVIPLRQLDAFYCVHINGSITFRFTSKAVGNTYSVIVSYNVAHQPEATRLLKQAKVFGYTCDPVKENRSCVLLNDGRLLMWDLDCPNTGVLQLLPPSFSQPPRILLAQMSTPLHGPPLVLQSSLHVSRDPKLHLLAVGSGKGTIQIYQLYTNELLREYFIQNSPVQGVEWVTEGELLIFAHPYSTTPAALVRSEVSFLDLATGTVRLIRKSAADESAIRAIKVAPTKDHFVLIFKNGAPEVWSIRDGRHLMWQRPRSVPDATAAEWVIVVPTTPSSSEESLPSSKSRKILILFVDLKGLFQVFKVKGNTVHEDKTSVFATQTTIGHVTAMCRRKNKIVMGDVDGSLIKWIPSESMAETRNLNRGWIKSIKFSPKDRTMWAAVLFSDGLDVWEIETMELINQLKPKTFKVNSLDWVSATHLALACTDGLIRIFDCRNFVSCSTVVNKEALHDRVLNAYLDLPEVTLRLKSISMLDVAGGIGLTAEQKASPWTKDSTKFDFTASGFEKCLSVPALQLATVDRCLMAAVTLGDESDLNFWNACLRSLPSTNSRIKALLGPPENNFFLDKNSFKTLQVQIEDLPRSSLFCPLYRMNLRQTTHCFFTTVFLEVNEQRIILRKATSVVFMKVFHEFLTAKEMFLGITRIVLADSRALNKDSHRQCVRDLISLGEAPSAVEYLLGLDPSEEHYYADCLKAALITALSGSSSETVQSTIKLVATNLIASTSLVSSGIELMCMIGKVLDACRYLQSCGSYNDAAVLAAISLDSAEAREVCIRWMDHLCAPEINQKSFALLLSLHAGCFDRALELMAASRQFERAALFLLALEEDGLLDGMLERNAVICEAVYLEYARYLHSIGLKSQAATYCDKGGENGRLLRREFEFLNEDNRVHTPTRHQ